MTLDPPEWRSKGVRHGLSSRPLSYLSQDSYLPALVEGGLWYARCTREVSLFRFGRAGGRGLFPCVILC
jgi:hypothetical protein